MFSIVSLSVSGFPLPVPSVSLSVFLLVLSDCSPSVSECSFSVMQVFFVCPWVAEAPPDSEFLSSFIFGTEEVMLSS